MDQVFFITKGHEVYVGEYYKKEIKQVKFQDKDFWEVFDQHDFVEFVEHLNYPMNYNEFRDNKVRILYDNPQKYEMFYSIQHVFNKAFDIQVGQLLPYIKKAYTAKYRENEEVRDKPYIMYEQTYYRIVHPEKVIEFESEPTAERVERFIQLEILQDLDEEVLKQVDGQVCEITTSELSKALFEDDTMMVVLKDYYPVLAPVNLYQKGVDWEKQKFLETHHIINQLKVVSNHAVVNKGTVLFEYTKMVHKLFGRQQKQLLQKKAPCEGVYFDYYQSNEEKLWARRGQFIGIIGHETDTPDVLQRWIKKVGF